MKDDRKRAPGFAPEDLTDGRNLLDWKTKYTEKSAKIGITLEAIYLAFLLFIVPALVMLIWLEVPNIIFKLSKEQYNIFSEYFYTWLGGTFGGTLFDIKWLYHSVAKQMWHVDRRLWRLFTPHISGALAFVVLLLISSGFFQIFDQAAFMSPSICLVLGFLIGYFSDTAMAKLTEIAETIFGFN